MRGNGGEPEESSSQDWREFRRLRAWQLKRQGWTQARIAQALGVTPGAVSQWMRRGREGGVEALRRRKPKGAVPRLSPEQHARLSELLKLGPKIVGVPGRYWTTTRVRELILREFGVCYHRAHVGRILRARGWRIQLPTKLARRQARRKARQSRSEQDEEA